MKKTSKNGFKVLSKDEGEKLLDRQALKYLGISGEEFVRRWNAKEFPDPDRPEIIRVAFLLPLAG